MKKAFKFENNSTYYNYFYIVAESYEEAEEIYCNEFNWYIELMSNILDISKALGHPKAKEE